MEKQKSTFGPEWLKPPYFGHGAHQPQAPIIRLQKSDFVPTEQCLIAYFLHFCDTMVSWRPKNEKAVSGWSFIQDPLQLP